MKYKIKFTKKFKKHLKQAKKQGKDIEKLFEIIEKIAKVEILDEKYRIEYPKRVIREVLVNALIHRDYTVIGSEVHVDIYDDRLEIFSP